MHSLFEYLVQGSLEFCIDPRKRPKEKPHGFLAYWSPRSAREEDSTEIPANSFIQGGAPLHKVLIIALPEPFYTLKDI
jgi:hypothetical protein